ncbi:hypothetical protein [Kitasatospora sp. McL0602]|uniref:hypothetical protein n=1 Tax=Kitasatospora sp. McL0602 TaxID=3439530 RepID=UPI003F8C36DA
MTTFDVPLWLIAPADRKRFANARKRELAPEGPLNSRRRRDGSPLRVLADDASAFTDYAARPDGEEWL